MTDINLLQVKKALNEIEDGDCERLFITHRYFTEDPEDGLCLIAMGEDWRDFFDNEKYADAIDMLRRFVTETERDCMKIVSVKIGNEEAEDYCDDDPIGAA